MGRTVAIVFVLGCVTNLMGCASARYVSKQGDSGVVAIPSNTNSPPFRYRQEAEELMRKHVGPDFEIVDEREVVTGSRVMNNQETQTQMTPNKKQPNMPGERISTNGMVTSTNTTEYQITYRKRGATGGGASTIQPAGGAVPARSPQP
ncbi:hypothetical protein R5W24_001362 [Gemmata sp. JC717]|uniref:Uncharacterized protein n=1 Tax=Gemmata algarum TaxID=2975278 RepID=A0ABU5EV21_9BACT|nr:hypothetical protein [Gemmata algarum]MDY3552282.1 hypothetical protein [Gemmata algarum]MDY3558818.1 hypothetical protein [Gemmata algarum]